MTKPQRQEMSLQDALGLTDEQMAEQRDRLAADLQRIEAAERRARITAREVWIR